MISNNGNGRFHDDEEEDDDNLNYHENPDDDRGPSGDGHTAVPLHLVACRLATAENIPSSQFALVTLATLAGVESEVLLPLPEARRLTLRLIHLLRHPEPQPVVPLKKWLVPHAVLRAELNVEEFGNQALAKLKSDMTEVGEFVERELAAVRRSLSRNPRPRVTTILKRLERLVLVAVDASRSDT